MLIISIDIYSIYTCSDHKKGQHILKVISSPREDYNYILGLTSRSFWVINALSYSYFILGLLPFDLSVNNDTQVDESLTYKN